MRLMRELIPFAVRAGLTQWRHNVRQGLQCVPGACPLCGQRSPGAALCSVCHSFVTHSMRNGAPRCVRCALALDSASATCADCLQQNFVFTRVGAAFDYQHPGDLLVRQFKQNKRFGMAPMLSQLMKQAFDGARPQLPCPDLVVPVPSHPQALRQRGFSPARELVARLCGAQGWTANYHVLRHRNVAAVSQKHLSRHARAEQARSLYDCTLTLNGASVLVVDDVLTTGSTLDAVARALLQGGAGQVVGLVLARTPRRLRAQAQGAPQDP